MADFVFPARAYVVVGLLLFVFGLLTILGEPSLSWLVLQIVPNSQSVLVFGAVVQSVGQAVLIYGVVKMNSANFLSALQSERQLAMTAIARNNEQISRMQSERQAIVAGYTQAMAKVDNLLAAQKQPTLMSKNAENCRYCGNKMEGSSFCPKCGKAN